MRVRLVCAVLGSAALVLGARARADFATALQAYNAGHFDTARVQFLELAELGDCLSQFNLGAMELKGQGSPPDRGSGVGWLQAALSNGCSTQVGNKLPALLASLTPEQSQAAAAIVARYGHEALQAQGIASPNFESARCSRRPYSRALLRKIRI
jgi:TPR repeat protein